MSIQERFIKACSEGNLKKVQKMLNNRILTFLKLLDIDKELNYRPPLLTAIEGSHYSTVKFLIDSGADVNKGNYYYTPLGTASENGHIEIVRLLIDSGADANIKTNDDTPLKTASEKGHIEVVKLLIDSGADVNKGGYLNRTPLWEASKNGHTEIVKLLIDSGADVNKGGYITPLMNSCENGNLEIIFLLIISGAKIDAKDSEGETALMYAAKSCKDFQQFKQIARLFFIAILDGDKIPDSEIKKLWEQINDYYERKRIAIATYERQREATCKGSIGHDKLNVNTYNPREWENRIRISMNSLEIKKQIKFTELINEI